MSRQDLHYHINSDASVVYLDHSAFITISSVIPPEPGQARPEKQKSWHTINAQLRVTQADPMLGFVNCHIDLW